METAKMKKKFIALLILTFGASTAFVEIFGIVKMEKIGTRAVFELPYRNVNGRYKYFNEKVKSALIIDAITLNGKPLIPVPDCAAYFALEDEYETEWIHSHQQFSYISMSWRKDKDKNWIFPYRGDLFVAAPGAEITVSYRIVYPFPFGNSEKLLQRRFDKKYISPAYSATIILPAMKPQ